MQDVLAALAAQHADLWMLLSGAEESDFALPSACAGWTVADVVIHLSQTDELAVASVRGQFGDALGRLTSGAGGAGNVDEGAARMVELARGQAASRIRDRWRTGADLLRGELAQANPHDRVQWVAGQLSVHTLAATRLAEAWIHTGDVGSPFGVPTARDERLKPICRLAWRTVPYAFARAGRQLSGPVSFELVGPVDEPWTFVGEGEPVTVIRGKAEDLCAVAGRRASPSQTGLSGSGPDVDTVLQLVRTYA